MTRVHDKPPRYRSYLLRAWEARSERAGVPSTWRFSLQDARTGQERAFADLEALVAYLQAEMARQEDGPGEGRPAGDPA
jgi:hypothetical protein